MNDQEILNATGRLRVDAKASIRKIDATMTANLLSINMIRWQGNADHGDDLRERCLAYSLKKFAQIYMEAKQYLWSAQQPAADIREEYERLVALAKKIDAAGKAFEKIAPILKTQMLQENFISTMLEL